MTDRLPFDDDDEGVYLFVEVRDLLRFQVTNLSLSSTILFFFVSLLLLLLLLFVSLSLDQFFWLTKILLAHKTLCLKHIIHFVKIIVVSYYNSFCHRRLLFIIIAKDKRGVRSRNFLLSGG